jgi:hypothetical protein
MSGAALRILAKENRTTDAHRCTQIRENQDPGSGGFGLMCVYLLFICGFQRFYVAFGGRGAGPAAEPENG